MSTISDLQGQVAAIAAGVQDIQTKVTDLKNQPPPVATQADLDALSGSLTTVQAQIDAIKAL